VGAMNGAEDKAAVAEAVRETVQETGFQPESRGFGDEQRAAAGADEDDDRELTPEELAAIDADPKLKQVYRNIKRQFYQKTGTLAEQRKQAEEALGAFDTIRTNPRESIRAMAEAAGMRVVGEPTVEDEIMADLTRSVGKEAADILGPSLVRTVAKLTNKIMAPLTQEREQVESAKNTSAIRSEIAGFGQRIVDQGGEFSEEIEREMAALVPKMPPGPNATLPDYLDVLHANVMAKRRGRPARGRAPVGTIKAGMDPREAARIAVAQARRDLGR
jgi:hypothetical protein